MNKITLKWLAELIESHIKVLESLKKQYSNMGGDVTIFGPYPEPCPQGYVKNDKGECVPDEGR